MPLILKHSALFIFARFSVTSLSSGFSAVEYHLQVSCASPAGSGGGQISDRANSNAWSQGISQP
jgi:hypothetical protein